LAAARSKVVFFDGDSLKRLKVITAVEIVGNSVSPVHLLGTTAVKDVEALGNSVR
jgi:hypothetical protein